MKMRKSNKIDFDKVMEVKKYLDMNLSPPTISIISKISRDIIYKIRNGYYDFLMENQEKKLIEHSDYSDIPGEDVYNIETFEVLTIFGDLLN